MITSAKLLLSGFLFGLIAAGSPLQATLPKGRIPIALTVAESPSILGVYSFCDEPERVFVVGTFHGRQSGVHDIKINRHRLHPADYQFENDYCISVPLEPWQLCVTPPAPPVIELSINGQCTLADSLGSLIQVRNRASLRRGLAIFTADESGMVDLLVKAFGPFPNAPLLAENPPVAAAEPTPGTMAPASATAVPSESLVPLAAAAARMVELSWSAPVPASQYDAPKVGRLTAGALMDTEFAADAGAAPGAIADSNEGLNAAGALDCDEEANAEEEGDPDAYSSAEDAAEATATSAPGSWSGSKLPVLKRRRVKLGIVAEEGLKTWFRKHVADPYPTQQEAAELMASLNLTQKQCTNWFSNTRKRFWYRDPQNPQNNRLEETRVAKVAGNTAPGGKPANAKAVQGGAKNQTATRNKEPLLPFQASARQCLKAWAAKHITDPYPTDAQRRELAAKANISYDQVGQWFVNYRMRNWDNHAAELHATSPSDSQAPTRTAKPVPAAAAATGPASQEQAGRKRSASQPSPHQSPAAATNPGESPADESNERARKRSKTE